MDGTANGFICQWSSLTPCITLGWRCTRSGFSCSIWSRILLYVSLAKPKANILSVKPNRTFPSRSCPEPNCERSQALCDPKARHPCKCRETCMEGGYPNGLMFVASHCSDPAKEEEFNAWYNHIHFPDWTAPGVFRHGRRFVNTAPEPADGHQPRREVSRHL